MGSDIVLDASAAGKLLRQEAESAALRVWIGREVADGSRLRVPPIFPFEVRHMAAKSAAEGTFRDPKSAHAAYLAIMDLVEVEDKTTDVEVEIATALRAKLSTYDASYLILARGARLVTYDTRLAKAAVSEYQVPALSPK
ncbi:MAG: type II toxin-antitoxin system VapC family toxin [Thermoplasmatota archaeon]